MTKGLAATKYVMHDGETKSIAEWATALGVNKETMRCRVRDWEKGEMTEDSCFKLSTTPLKPQLKKSTNDIRQRSLNKLFKAIEKYAMPKVDEEMQRYMETGEFGPALNLYLKLAKFYPVEKMAETNPQHKSAVAQMALVIHTGDKPTHLAKIEGT
jgi:hypothetical protein